VLVEGKSALKDGVAPFMAAASAAYSRLGSSEKKDLEIQGKEKMLTLTSAAVKKRGAKVFEKIEKLVGEMLLYILYVYIYI